MIEDYADDTKYDAKAPMCAECGWGGDEILFVGNDYYHVAHVAKAAERSATVIEYARERGHVLDGWQENELRHAVKFLHALAREGADLLVQEYRRRATPESNKQIHSLVKELGK